MAQRLVRKLCPECAIKAAPSETEAAWIKEIGEPVPPHVWKPAGCCKCSQTGYAGRSGLFEFWQVTEEDYQLILNHTDEHTLRRQLAEKKHCSLLQAGFEKLVRGITSVAELKKAAGNGI